MIHAHKNRHILPLVLAGTLLAGLAAYPRPAAAHQDSLRTISLTGTGVVRAVPDEAVISIGVVEQGTSAADAVKANSAAMTKVLASLKDSGIADKDVQTSDFSVNPRYNYPKDNSGSPTIDGYEVSNRVTVKIRDLSALGAVLDKVVSSGSNQVNGISFTLSNRDAAENEARKQAVADAKAKAELYAKAAGITLGPIYALAESGQSYVPQPMARQTFAMKASQDSVPVAQGEQTISIEVNITWQLN